MKQDFQSFHANLSALDDQAINPSANVSLEQLVDRSRRNLLKGGMGLAALGFLGGSLGACRSAVQSESLIGFKGIPTQLDPAFDSVQVAPGYSARTFFSWGDAVMADAPEWNPDATDDWQAQLKQAGDNHDGMHFFPFPENPDSHGLLVMNHEYVNPPLHPNGMTFTDGKRPLDEVRKEQAAHGVSVIEVKKDAQGQWQRVMPSRYNRRISGMTPMAVSGPLAGNDALKTASDPSGREIIGTLNNCSSGVTPWGTYLVCEENWHNYFVNHDAADLAKRVSHKRYGIEGKGLSKLYGWETADARFNATPDPAQPHGGHVHEPNRFGWVVEVDPFDPASKPVKRTAFGRYCRECSVLSLGDDGRMAFYSGDDTKGEYVYKFVPSGRYIAGDDQANRRLLDDGTLYVARFNADGSGEWLALVHGQNGLTAENGFADQAEVLLNARAAGDHVGATPMDRPEWVAVHPRSREVYVTLTNNDNRGIKWPTDKANPRPVNLHGQILRWSEKGADPTATAFTWEVFLLAGEQPGAKGAEGEPVPANLTGTINGDIFSSPDGLAFDSAGRLWIETDYGDEEAAMQAMGTNQLLCADPRTREVRRFLVGPRGCEITGITWSPDYRAMWINVQHPELSFPASDGKTRPRASTVLITKDDGGIIGT
ncbi:PhoX family protein [Stutzerimonas zhaodongensis]|uniref:PhoX family phosphatase n=1 Tax=Stutzerimonas zhaodongensis TaxID=1176257 RepID=A0A365PXM2_9GAMM|nr:PhoX family phosphatase [Stutzerimonas zhaodongensis]QWV16499.1 PhoX family phosphatase [Stutzerimonas zhaodongensis]RBA60993.1 PhoX family phosphatase [Stutzerimonas zhaodongensis]